MPYEQLPIPTAKPVLSWANHDLSRDELRMATNVASLPFVFKHVALMSVNCHYNDAEREVHYGEASLRHP